MASTYTNQLKYENPAEYDLLWHIGWRRNQAINELLVWQQARNNFVNSGGGLTYSAGLEIDIAAGSVNIAGIDYTITAATLTLAPGTATTLLINFIYVSSTGVLTVSSTPPATTHYCMIAMVDCNDISVTLQNDMRLDSPAASSLTPPAGVSLTGGVTGLNFSNAVSDLFNDISISPGACFDSTGVKPILLPAAMVKDSSAAWVEGNNNGGMLLGNKSTDSVYMIYAIRRDSDGFVDIGFLDQVEPIENNLPAGYSIYRAIGFFLTDGSANNRLFKQTGDIVNWSYAWELSTSTTGSYVPVDISAKLPAAMIEKALICGVVSGQLIPISYATSPYGADQTVETNSGVWWNHESNTYLVITDIDGYKGFYVSSQTYPPITWIKEVTFIR